MNQIYQLLCDLLTNRCGKTLHAKEIEAVYQLANSHNVWLVLFPNLKALYQQGKAEIPEAQTAHWEKEYFFNVIQNVRRTAYVHKTIRAIEKAGIPCCILKGEVLSQLYPVPEARISGDTDLYIGEGHEEAVAAIVKELGYEIEQENVAENHMVAKHPVGGVIELHTQLHDELYEEVWFDKQSVIREPYRTVVSEGEEFHTLGYTDGAVFVTLHMIKHFLFQGVGIRQVYDTLLYLKAYREQIDFAYFNGLMKHLKYDRFMDAVYSMGVKRLGFATEDFPAFTMTEEEALFEEIMTSGSFGFTAEQRQGFYVSYTKERFQRFRQEDYKNYMKQYHKVSVWEIVFLSMKQMKEKYPYLKKMPWLLPVAWVQRIFYLIVTVLSGKKKVTEYTEATNHHQDSEFVQKKMELVRDLDMI